MKDYARGWVSRKVEITGCDSTVSYELRVNLDGQTFPVTLYCDSRSEFESIKIGQYLSMRPILDRKE